MATTQHRAHSALSARRFGSFAGRPEGPTSTHPVGRIVQHRPSGAFAGRRYGSFAGKPGGGLNEWFLAGVEELAFVASITASGDFETGVLVDAAEPIALVATITASGDFSFTTTPAPEPGSRFIGPRVGLRANGELIILF